jgi:hypothetical protein
MASPQLNPKNKHLKLYESYEDESNHQPFAILPNASSIQLFHDGTVALGASHFF